MISETPVSSATRCAPRLNHKAIRYARFNAGPSRTALPAAHFERNDVTIVCETVH
jgi:hypothetical protein